MGRALIIKDADFSGVAVETVPIGGRFYLTRNNSASVVDKYIEGETQKWRQDTATALYVYPLSVGDVVIAKEYGYKCVMNMVNAIGDIATLVDFADGNTHKLSTGSMTGTTAQMPVALKAQEDCLLVVYGYEGNGVDYFPSNLFIENAPGMRVLTSDDAMFTSPVYLKADGTWGNSGDGNPSFYFNVYEGDVIKVKAQAGKNTAIAFLDYNGFPKDGKAVLVPGETGRRSVAGGTEETFVAPTDCAMYVYGTDVGVSYFPESLIINPES